MPSGMFRPYQLDESFSNFSDVNGIYYFKHLKKNKQTVNLVIGRHCLTASVLFALSLEKAAGLI